MYKLKIIASNLYENNQSNTARREFKEIPIKVSLFSFCFISRLQRSEKL